MLKDKSDLRGRGDSNLKSVKGTVSVKLNIEKRDVSPDPLPFIFYNTEDNIGIKLRR